MLQIEELQKEDDYVLLIERKVLLRLMDLKWKFNVDYNQTFETKTSKTESGNKE